MSDLSKLTAKCDLWMSRYVRALAVIDDLVECSTCGCKKPPELMENGHYVKRTNMSTRFELRNTSPQCPGCNHSNDGESDLMADYLDRTWGPGTAEKMKILGRQIKKYSREELEKIADKYHTWTNEILAEKRLTGWW